MASNSEDIFSILIATDNHLGVYEEDPERGNDALNTFEEVLELAVEHSVDFILLGGDLFHKNKPSRHTLVSCMQLLKKYTLGDRPVHFDFVSDPSENFPNLKNPSVNYQDPNLNISIPVFSIHGNHDDPSGLGQFCELDVISTAGLINYFGRVTNLKEIQLSPLLLTKGKTKLALYGLSSIKDERLFRLFREAKVKMLRPKEDTEKWFNVFVLHQNHVRHSPTNYIPEEFLDKFLDLVIWGHEHECQIDPRQTKDGFYVVQPGSSVATSMSIGESVKKKVAILEVSSEKRMRITPLELKTVRPFIFDELCLEDHNIDCSVKKNQFNPIEQFIEEKVWSLVEESKKLLTGHPRQPTKPLIRLRVEYSDESQIFNAFRFGHKFAEAVANPDEILLFRKKKKDSKKKDEIDGIDEDVMENVFQQIGNETKVEDLVKRYFEEVQEDKDQLHLLTERELASAVSKYIEKDDKDAIADIFSHQIKKTKEHLLSLQDFDEENIENAIYNFYIERINRDGAEEEDHDALVAMNEDKRYSKREGRPSDSGHDITNESDEDLSLEEDSKQPQPQNARRSSRGQARARARGRTTTPTASSRQEIVLSSDEEINCTASKSSTRGKGRGRGRARAASSNSNTRNQSIKESFSRSAQRCKKSYFDSDED